MKQRLKKARVLPRLPIKAVEKLGSRPVTTKKGKKGYGRKRLKENTRETIYEEGTK